MPVVPDPLKTLTGEDLERVRRESAEWTRAFNESTRGMEGAPEITREQFEEARKMRAYVHANTRDLRERVAELERRLDGSLGIEGIEGRLNRLESE